MAARSSVCLKILNDAMVIISLGLVHLIKIWFSLVLSAPAFPFPLFYYYFPSSNFYICLFPSFLPLFAYKFVFFLFFFFQSFGLLVCLSVVLSSLTYLVLFGVFSICFKNFRSQSVFFNKPKLFSYPQNLCNT